MTVRWYGADASWWAPFERDARRRDGDLIRVELGDRRLTYVHDGLEVRGLPRPIPVRIEFHADPPYQLYGLRPQDFPRVLAAPGEASKHRMPDGSLCLFFPGDPPERRWSSTDGLLALLVLIRDHLFAEHHWHVTGGAAGGQWALPEAPHGFPERGAA